MSWLVPFGTVLCSEALHLWARGGRSLAIGDRDPGDRDGQDDHLERQETVLCRPVDDPGEDQCGDAERHQREVLAYAGPVLFFQRGLSLGDEKSLRRVFFGAMFSTVPIAGRPPTVESARTGCCVVTR